jgi:hypothetical protein
MHLKSYEICNLLREAFPDETVKDGQRLTKAQVGILNRCIVEIKARDARLAALAESRRHVPGRALNLINF